MRRVLSGFATLSEFGAYHGDCGELATLAALHSLNPAAWPLTLAKLNELTAAEIGAGNADPILSGGQNIPNLDAYLTRLGVAHTTVGYAQFALDALHTTLQQLAGVHPIIVEWARGGALPGDEPGVAYHYSCCGGIDPDADAGVGGYLWADGDNRASPTGDGGGPPLLYTWPQIVAAQPIAYIVITEAPTMGAPQGWDDTGAVLTAPNGRTVEHAFRFYIINRPWPADLCPVTGDQGDGHGGNLQDFRHGNGDAAQEGTRLVWNGSAVSEQALAAPPPPVPAAPVEPEATAILAALAQVAAALAVAAETLQQLTAAK